MTGGATRVYVSELLVPPGVVTLTETVPGDPPRRQRGDGGVGQHDERRGRGAEVHCGRGGQPRAAQGDAGACSRRSQGGGKEIDILPVLRMGIPGSRGLGTSGPSAPTLCRARGVALLGAPRGLPSRSAGPRTGGSRSAGYQIFDLQITLGTAPTSEPRDSSTP